MSGRKVGDSEALREVQRQALAAGFYSPVDMQLARLVAPEAALLQLVLASVSRALRQGHPCLPLSVLAGSPIVDEESRAVFFTFPEERALLELVREAPCVAVTGDDAAHPFVLELSHDARVVSEGARLYSLRMHLHEKALAEGLRRLLERPAAFLDAAWVQSRLDHYFPSSAAQHDSKAQGHRTAEGDSKAQGHRAAATAHGGEHLSAEGQVDWQREAVRRALGTRFSVISGGPGTGKTSTVVKLLSLLTEAALHSGAPSPRLLLLAPTGKAAARMSESIQSALGRLALPEQIARAVAARASTVHRALGVRPDSRTRFRHHRHAPLLADIVLVDEASMVDLALMRALVDALPDDAQLILLGDRHQLASVEAGSVLSELCAALEDGPVTELKKSYRFSEDSGIAALATALREGEVDAVERILGTPPSDLRFVGTDEPPARLRELRRSVVEGYRAALAASGARSTSAAGAEAAGAEAAGADGDFPGPAAALERAGDFRILCAHRRGEYGVEQVNALCRSWLARAGLVPPTGEHYRGRLLLVTENDYSLDLRNGDIGIVWPDPTVKDRVQLAAFFPATEGRVRRLSLAQLPACETAFAMTIHKSQGSEYGKVAVIVPPAHSPLLSRELLYTAVTRAKERVELFGPLAAVAHATSARVLRHSGLASRLRG